VGKIFVRTKNCTSKHGYRNTIVAISMISTKDKEVALYFIEWSKWYNLAPHWKKWRQIWQF